MRQNIECLEISPIEVQNISMFSVSKLFSLIKKCIIIHFLPSHVFKSQIRVTFRSVILVLPDVPLFQNSFRILAILSFFLAFFYIQGHFFIKQCLVFTSFVYIRSVYLIKLLNKHPL